MENQTVKVGATLQGVLPSVPGFSGAKWTTSNPAKAKVNTSGIITGVAEGTCTITGKSVKPFETDLVIINLTVEAAQP